MLDESGPGNNFEDTCSGRSCFGAEVSSGAAFQMARVRKHLTGCGIKNDGGSFRQMVKLHKPSGRLLQRGIYGEPRNALAR